MVAPPKETWLQAAALACLQLTIDRCARCANMPAALACPSPHPAFTCEANAIED